MEGKKEQFMSEGKRPSLEDFQHEIEVLAMQEQRGEVNDVHFLVENSEERTIHPDFHGSDLTEEDMQIWEQLQNGSIDKNEFEVYQEKMARLNEEGKVPTSRYIFSQYVAHHVPRKLMERAIREGKMKLKDNIA